MRYQEREYSCGPSAVVNALRSLGKRVSEKRVRALSECSSDGTDEHDLISAVRQLGCTATSHWSADGAAAWAFVRANVLDGRPCLVCIDAWGHWSTVVGIVGDRVLLVDPRDTKANRSENGLHSLSRTALLEKWRCPNEDEPFYAIAIGK